MPDSKLTKVSVVIPTLCDDQRRDTLPRAIASASNQEGVCVDIIVVVNGDRFHPELFSAIKSLPFVRTAYQQVGSVPLALCHGRALVEAPYFTFLDDDDEYLPNALAQRVRVMRDNPSVDFVASNGYIHKDGQDRLYIDTPEMIHADPLRALLARNWLASCGGLYRSASIPPSDFDTVTPYFEWTYLAFKLLATKCMRFLDVPSFRVHDSLVSLSKSEAYHQSEIDALSRIAKLDMPRDVRWGLYRKIGHSHHDLSDSYRRKQNYSRSWHHHLRSLIRPGGYRHLAYSRKLIPWWSR